MRNGRIALIALLAAAGCSISDPREDAVLFDSPEERARRDLFALYYLVSDNGGVFSIVVPRVGAAESRAEVSPEVVAEMRRVGWPIQRRMEGGRPVADTHRDAIEQFFAGLPAGTSERTLSTDPKQKSAEDRKRMPPPYCEFGPEPTPPPPARVRILHVSKSGELKTLILLKAPSKELPPGTPAGGATVETIDELFLWLGSPKDVKFPGPGKADFK